MEPRRGDLRVENADVLRQFSAWRSGISSQLFLNDRRRADKGLRTQLALFKEYLRACAIQCWVDDVDTKNGMSRKTKDASIKMQDATGA